MILALFLVAAGLIAGMARGGKLANLSNLELRLTGLVFGGLALQIGAEIGAASFLPQLAGSSEAIVVLGLSYALLIWFLVVNRRLAGTVIIGVGLALNLTVILANRAMPVSLRAVRAAGASQNFLEGAVKHEAMTPGTILAPLGDVIPIPFVGSVVSVGDVVLGIGMFLLVERAVRYIPKRGATGG